MLQLDGMSPMDMLTFSIEDAANCFLRHPHNDSRALLDVINDAWQPDTEFGGGEKKTFTSLEWWSSLWIYLRKFIGNPFSKDAEQTHLIGTGTLGLPGLTVLLFMLSLSETQFYLDHEFSIFRLLLWLWELMLAFHCEHFWWALCLKTEKKKFFNCKFNLVLNLSFAALLLSWEMIVPYYKGSQTQIFIKCGLINH